MLDNIIKMIDSYKVGHWKQMPPGISRVYSYIESRGGEFWYTCFFGLQYFLHRYLAGQVVTGRKIQQARERFAKHLGDPTIFNEAGWMHILDKYNGRLPLRIKAVPEGTVVPTSNVLVTIENTDPACYWLPGYVETLLDEVWSPMTVATQSRWIKADILGFLRKTGTPADIYHKLVDFGFRGVSSPETAALAGAGHLVNFHATENQAALDCMEEYYDEEIAGYSIPAAAEHSSIITWGKAHEVNAFRNMLTQFPTGLVAVVSDSYDIFHACEHLWGEQLRDMVLQRDGVLVVRPDSGDPIRTVLRVLDILGTKFGSELNDKRYRVLNPHVRVIQGDGVNRFSIRAILQEMLDQSWSADNITFGSGGALLQKINRDTQQVAMKPSWVEIDGKGYEVCKEPVGDVHKRSKKGRLKLIDREGWPIHTSAEFVEGLTEQEPDAMQLVFYNGVVYDSHNSCSQIRKRADLRVA